MDTNNISATDFIEKLKKGQKVYFPSVLNESGGKHVHEAINSDIKKFLAENNAVMLSATQIAHLLETGFKSFEEQEKYLEKQKLELENQLKTATAENRKTIQKQLDDLSKLKNDVDNFAKASMAKAPIGNEIHKLLELYQKGSLNLFDTKFGNIEKEIFKIIEKDKDTREKLKGLVTGNNSVDQKNLKNVILSARKLANLQKKTGQKGGETETSRSMAFLKNGKVYVVSGSTDWSDVDSGQIGDIKTTSDVGIKHNLIQSNINAALMRAEAHNRNKKIKSVIHHLPVGKNRISLGSGDYYNIDVGSQDAIDLLLNNVVDVLEGQKKFDEVKIPGRFYSKESSYINSKGNRGTLFNEKTFGDIVKWKSTNEVLELYNSLPPDSQKHFLGLLYGRDDSGKYWNEQQNADALREIFSKMKPIQSSDKKYGGKSLSAISKEFLSGIIGEKELSGYFDGISDKDIEDIISRLFYGEGKEYFNPKTGKKSVPYTKAFVDAVKRSLEHRGSQRIWENLYREEVDRGMLGELMENPVTVNSSKDMYTPEVWEIEDRKNEMKLLEGKTEEVMGITENTKLQDDVQVLADRLTRLLDLYTRITNIFNNIVDQVNDSLPDGMEKFTGESLARTYLARNNPAAYNRYMRSKSLQEKYINDNIADLSPAERVGWLKSNIDLFGMEEGDIFNKLDTLFNSGDNADIDNFYNEFVRKSKYITSFGKHIAPNTLRGLMENSSFGIEEDGYLFDIERDKFGPTISSQDEAELKEKAAQLEEAQDNIDNFLKFYKDSLLEHKDEYDIGKNPEAKINKYINYLKKVGTVDAQLKKIHDTDYLTSSQSLLDIINSVDQNGFLKRGSNLEKNLRGNLLETSLNLPSGLTPSNLDKLLKTLEEGYIQFEDSLAEESEEYYNKLEEIENKRQEAEAVFSENVESTISQLLQGLVVKQESKLISAPSGYKFVKGTFDGGSKSYQYLSKKEDLDAEIKEIDGKKYIIDEKGNNFVIEDISDTASPYKKGVTISDFRNFQYQQIGSDILDNIENITKEAVETTDVDRSDNESAVDKDQIASSELIANKLDTIIEIVGDIRTQTETVDWQQLQDIVSSGGGSGSNSGDGNGSGGNGSGGGDGDKSEKEKQKDRKAALQEYDNYLRKMNTLEVERDKYVRAEKLSWTDQEKASNQQVIADLDAQIVSLKEINKYTEDNAFKADETAAARIKETRELEKQTKLSKNFASRRGQTTLRDVINRDIQNVGFRIANFSLVSRLISKIPQSLNRVKQTTEQLEQALMNLRVVTGYNRKEGEALLVTYNSLSKQLGATTVEVANAADAWLRQGYSVADAENLIAASMKLSKLGKIDSAQATKSLKNNNKEVFYMENTTQHTLDKRILAIAKNIENGRFPSKEDFLSVYDKYHSRADICKIFNICSSTFKKLVKYYNLPPKDRCVHAEDYIVRKEKIAKSLDEKYGPLGSETRNAFYQKSKEKMQKTCLEKYGTINPSELNFVKEKRKMVFLDKYGVENPMQCQAIFEKASKTNEERYGYKYTVICPEIQKKIKKSILEKYGTLNVMGLPETREKVEKTNMERWGFKTPLSNPEIRKKGFETMSKNGQQAVLSSSQQNYINNLFGGQLNHLIEYYHVDSFLIDENIGIEYSGGGHDVSVRSGRETREHFEAKEMARKKYFINHKIPILEFISKKDILPSDEILFGFLNDFREKVKNGNLYMCVDIDSLKVKEII